jgi:hypothetical protein
LLAHGVSAQVKEIVGVVEEVGAGGVAEEARVLGERLEKAEEERGVDVGIGAGGGGGAKRRR